MRKSVSKLLRKVAESKSDDKAFYRHIKKTWNKLTSKQKTELKQVYDKA